MKAPFLKAVRIAEISESLSSGKETFGVPFCDPILTSALQGSLSSLVQSIQKFSLDAHQIISLSHCYRLRHPRRQLGLRYPIRLVRQSTST